MREIGTGISDFKKIIENDNLFIDKTEFIKEIIDNGEEVLLFPRPRRFGKSLNLSMLNYFFDVREDAKNLFNGLNITKFGDKYLQEMNRYPVIYVTLKDVKKDTYEGFIQEYKRIIVNLYDKYKEVLDTDILNQYYREYYIRCMNGTEIDSLSKAIAILTEILHKYYDNQVIVLMDEYDVPIMQSRNKYYDECITFMKEVFSSTFKDNYNLRKGIITGVLRISKEGMFTDANNIIIYNITDYRFAKYFGFTEEEVKKVLREYHLEDTFDDVKKWYDGYNFKGNVIYNPWSILNYLSNTLHELKPYWVNTGGVELIKQLIYDNKYNPMLLERYHRLLENGYIDNVEIDLRFDLNNLESNDNTIFTLFMLAGYLTPDENVSNRLRVPNLEIMNNLKNVCVKWFNERVSAGSLFEMYLLSNNLDKFKEDFINMTNYALSYYDVNKLEAESFYHAFTMGMLYNQTSNYIVKSNREAGFGRYDLVLKPKKESNSNYAYIIEFKISKDENDFSVAINHAFKQMNEMKYDIELLNEGYHVNKIAIAFNKKKVEIEYK